MDLDAVRTSFDGAPGSIGKLLHGLLHFGMAQRAWFRRGLHASRREHRLFGGNRGRPHRLAVMRSVVGVRNAARMHELDEEMTAGLVHGIRHLPPALDMGIGVDAGCGGVALSVVGRLRSLGNQKAKRCPLRVVFCCEVTGSAIGLGAAARHRRQAKAVGQVELSDGHGGPQGIHGCNPQAIDRALPVVLCNSVTLCY